MTLRTPGDLPTLRPRLVRLSLLLAGVAVLLTAFAGGSGAGVSDYQGTPLYLNGARSTVATASGWQMSGVSAGAQPAAPAPCATAPACYPTPGITGTFNYVYVTTDGSGHFVSSAILTLIAANAKPTLTGIPAGADLYREKTGSAIPTTAFQLVASSVPAGASYTDTTADPVPGMPAVLPEALTRVAANITGWSDFTPGAAPPVVNSVVSPSSPGPPAVCKGWIVDQGGGVSFPAGTWTFQARLRSGNSPNGVAYLSAALYRVDASGVPLSTVIPPTDNSAAPIQNIPAGTTATVQVTATTASTTTLDSTDHLCLQFYRHQFAPYTSGTSTRNIWMLGYDPLNQVTAHPAPNALADAALFAPANGLHTTSTPTLSATYSDPEADAGTLTIRLCTDSAACASSPQNSGALAATDGQTLNWSPTALSDGQYWWQALAQDGSSQPTVWSSARTFWVDTTAPTTSITGQPPAQSNSTSGTFDFSANESVTGYQCKIDSGAFAGCATGSAYGPLADGPHTFSVKATADLAGNPGTTTTYSWTIDTAPPNTSITSSPSALSNNANPSFAFSSTEGSSTFECSLDGAVFSTCSNPQSYSSLANGAHTFQVRAIDPATNTDPSPASHAWTIDATPPDTTIGPSSPASLTIATGATFDFSSSEPGSTFQCALDGGAFSGCSTPKTYSALADGSHTFQVRAIDPAGNTDPSPASYTWTIDTTPPATSVGPTMPPANTPSSSATFDLGSNEGGSTFECRLDGAPFLGCTTPMNYSGLANGTHTFDVRATDPAGNVDTTPASYTWRIDNVAPSTPTLTAPADALVTSTLPQLKGTFNDASPGGDTGTVEFQICSTAAPAGSACAPVVQSATSGSVSNGGTASVTPGALADGTYHWQARAQDAAGNQSSWSATRSFQLDTVLPSVPVSGTPDDGAWVRSLRLTATFNKPSFAGTGTIEFRICSDSLCLGVVRTGSSGSVINGAGADWTPTSSPGDGLWYWQARAHDSYGNVSAWSASRIVHLDTVAPGKPLNFNGQIGADGLTLRWNAPSDTIANYVVYVDGAPWKNFGDTEFQVNVGPFDAGDSRTFSVVAVDRAGNVGAMSAVLVGVPNLVGLTWPQALGATSARGLALRRNAVLFSAIPMVVSSQDPSALTLAETGSAVLVTMTPVQGARLGLRVKPGRVVCAGGSVVRLRVQLSATALVARRLVGSRGRVLARGVVGNLRAGTSRIRVKLPRRLHRGGAYRLMFDANGEGGSAHALVRIKVGTRICRAR